MTHSGRVEYDWLDLYVANCSCGWQSIDHNTQEEARDALAAHYDEVSL